jgi:hypothetical protein
MKIVADEMGGIKVESFGEKSKGNQLALGQLDSWQLDKRIRR